MAPDPSAIREAVFNTIAGEPNLTPEESSSWNFGVAYTPKFEFIPGKLTIHVDYFQLQLLDPPLNQRAVPQGTALFHVP